MGVSVRMTRNTRVWLPWVVAVPVFLCVLAGWVLRLIVVAVVALVVWLARLVRR